MSTVFSFSQAYPLTKADSMFNFDRHMDLGKSLKAWGDKKEEAGSKESWYPVFDRFKAAKIIP